MKRYRGTYLGGLLTIGLLAANVAAIEPQRGGLNSRPVIGQPSPKQIEPPGVNFPTNPPTIFPTNQPSGQQIVAKPAEAIDPGPKWRILQNPNGPHTVLFFDPLNQSLAVYHVDAVTGQITLKSVRNLSADLQLPEYNSSKPSPKEIQQMIDEAN
jgi:hypothetical protein